MRPPLLTGAGGLFFCAVLCGCGAHPGTVPAAPTPGVDTLAPGVIHRAIPLANGTGVDVIDVDLNRASVRMTVATEGVGRVGGMISGRAYTPHEWLEKTRSLAAANGGYFGRDDASGRKEFVGLLVQNGRVRHAASTPRSSFGILPNGTPSVVWAATDAGQPQGLRVYSAPTGQHSSGRWGVWAAVGCGPMLLHDGHIRVTDRQERLVSPGLEARTFVACDRGTQHFLLGMASGMEYRDVARFVARYFPTYDRTQAADAMCLDGGASTQLSYRLPGGSVQSPRETGVTVPDAIVIVPRP